MYLDHLIKSALKKLGRNYGVHVRYMPRLINKGPDYEVVLPNATYSPWNLDETFICFGKGTWLVRKEHHAKLAHHRVEFTIRKR